MRQTGWQALGLGLGLMYFLDPVSGRRRRRHVLGRAEALVRDVGGAVAASAHDLENRATGVAARARTLAGTTSPEPVDDNLLIRRVRSKLGRFVSHPGSVQVLAHNGRVILRGPILATEVAGLLRAVASVPGVVGIDRHLDVHESPVGISGLQGGRPRNPRPPYDPRGWTPAACLAAGAAGAAVALKWSGRSPLPWLAAAGLVGLARSGRPAADRVRAADSLRDAGLESSTAPVSLVAGRSPYPGAPSRQATRPPEGFDRPPPASDRPTGL